MNVFGMVSTRGSEAYTPHALQSFFQTTPLGSRDLFFLIDNDNSLGGHNSLHPTVNLIRNEKPKGFAANVNEVLRIAASHKADLYFLNNDLIFTAHWLEPMLPSDRAVQLPASNWQIQYRHGELALAPVMDLRDYVGHERALTEIAQQHRLRHSGYEPRFAEFFFCVKIPYAVYSTVGEFDESFGVGGAEDIDYCLRCHLSGFKVAIALQSFVLHFMGKSTWRGGESQKQQRLREARYHRSFVAKWGERLAAVGIYRDRRILWNDPVTCAAFERGDFGAVVRRLKAALAEQDR